VQAQKFSKTSTVFVLVVVLESHGKFDEDNADEKDKQTRLRNLFLRSQCGVRCGATATGAHHTVAVRRRPRRSDQPPFETTVGSPAAWGSLSSGNPSHLIASGNSRKTVVVWPSRASR